MQPTNNKAGYYENNLARLKQVHHGQCLFNRKYSWMPEIKVYFDDEGVLHGEFTTTTHHQGYNGKLHGGLLAAIIDASMTQCMMGHGEVCYTADLSIKYINPITIGNRVHLVTRIVADDLGILYTLNCQIKQVGTLAAEATGRFFRFT